MNPQETNRRIAEHLGWRHFDDDWSLRGHWMAPWDNGKGPGQSYDDPPDFCGSLDAMAQIEATLTAAQLERYADALCDLVADGGCWPDPNISALIMASAALKSTALLSALSVEQETP